ncbi:hypothetical protein EHS25_009571 [Saitozyma podzolica]|uniref:Signal recognition particle subunit SRP72 n=1 Tax=Saitozyma podzolica TaxID=1890683 RepID=A0A427YJJ7_9TREE|nr:hypothetical protein EHS25_009571 [Saitozyma podzolica]
MSSAAKAPAAAGKADKMSKGRVFTPRPPRSAEERLPKLYHGLTDQLDGGYFQNAIKTCKKILHLDPSSLSTFQTLLFLRLHTDDYPAAIELLSHPPEAASSLEFERAYCLYRLHREKEALVVLEGLSSRGRKEEHLEAQIRYRLGEYEKAQLLYDDLLASCDSSSPEHDDIVTNLSATTAHLDFLSHEYHAHLAAAPPANLAAGSTSSHVPTEGELESFVPSLPTGWATGGVGTSKAAAKAPAPVKVEKKRTKPRHKLPKGAAPGKAFTQDPERWLPLKQRASYIASLSKKKGGKESMGTGFTQGSTHSASGGGGGGGGGGGKGKKGKKK